MTNNEQNVKTETNYSVNRATSIAIVSVCDGNWDHLPDPKAINPFYVGVLEKICKIKEDSPTGQATRRYYVLQQFLKSNIRNPEIEQAIWSDIRMAHNDEYWEKKYQVAAKASQTTQRPTVPFPTGLLTHKTLKTPPAPEQESEADFKPTGPEPWVADPDKAVYQGVAGHIVNRIAPHTEAHPLALLGNLLVLFGNCVGRGPHTLIEDTPHRCNEFILTVGKTAMGRKGTATNRVRPLFGQVEAAQGWEAKRIKGGLSSGEGLIRQVADPDDPEEPPTDKRLMILETEFSGVLRVLDREGNKLSEMIRQLWDHGNISTLTKKPLEAYGAHGSILGHITQTELIKRLGMIEMINGFANRFLYLAVGRVQELPMGGNTPQDDRDWCVAMLSGAIEKGRDRGEIGLTVQATECWVALYHDLTTPPDDALGEILSRGAPHVRRLAMIYALLDQTDVVDVCHLEAAHALWRASRSCVEFLFAKDGDVEDPREKKLLQAVSDTQGGMTRSQINVLFSNHDFKAIDRLIRKVIKSGKLLEIPVPTKGRTKYVYRLVV